MLCYWLQLNYESGPSYHAPAHNVLLPFQYTRSVLQQNKTFFSKLPDIDIRVTAENFTFAVRSSEPLYSLSPDSEIAKLVTALVCSWISCNRSNKLSFNVHTFRSYRVFSSELILQ